MFDLSAFAAKPSTTPAGAPDAGATGNDGLTDQQRAELAARWRAGAGAMPTKQDAVRMRAMAAKIRRGQQKPVAE